MLTQPGRLTSTEAQGVFLLLKHPLGQTPAASGGIANGEVTPAVGLVTPGPLTCQAGDRPLPKRTLMPFSWGELSQNEKCLREERQQPQVYSCLQNTHVQPSITGPKCRYTHVAGAKHDHTAPEQEMLSRKRVSSALIHCQLCCRNCSDPEPMDKA